MNKYRKVKIIIRIELRKSRSFEELFNRIRLLFRIDEFELTSRKSPGRLTRREIVIYLPHLFRAIRIEMSTKLDKDRFLEWALS